MFLKGILLSFLLTTVISAMTTKIQRNNPFLIRKKRYLAFPQKSNFVITMSFSKALLITQPRGWNLVGECDVPFALPSDTRWYKNFKGNHLRERRELMMGLETALTNNGFNGTACLNRMICEARDFVENGEKSLVRDMFEAIFMSYKAEISNCDGSDFTECETPIMSYILNSFKIN